MVAEAKFTEKPGEEKRDETLKLSDIDTDYLERLIKDQADNFISTFAQYFEDRSEWLQGLRDYKYRHHDGFFDNCSDVHIPYSQTMAKAMHARIFQVFSVQNLFNVESLNQMFEDKEDLVKFFMNWTLSKWVNRGKGKAQVIDDFILDFCEDGSATFKLGWDRWQDTYLDLDIVSEEVPDDAASIFLGEEGAEIEDRAPQVRSRIRNKKVTKVKAGPAIGTISNDDLMMPPGFRDPQTSPWAIHRIEMTDDELKYRVTTKRFHEEVVDEALERGGDIYPNRDDEAYNSRKRFERLEGVNDNNHYNLGDEVGKHEIYEWYGKAYVGPEVDDDTFRDIKELPQEIVVWYHVKLRKILGWTYLHRMSPSGNRPLYKADFMPSKERPYGIGVGELLWSINNHMDNVHNIKLDNAILASMQFGYYRAGSSFKPDTFEIAPGVLLPVEDVNDIKFQSLPYLGNFAEGEEQTLDAYGGKLLAINDVNLGNLSGKGVAGALRNATGANFIDRQANIQLNPHLDRIARIMDKMLSDLFILARSRMDAELFFRVTGEDGKPIFGDVKKEDLVGDYDFVVDTELAASSEQERQQRATLMMQTFLNPGLQQLGIVTPGNSYELAKKYLIAHNVRNPDKFITKPADYQGPPMTPESRIFKILMGEGSIPPIEDTVRLEEDHDLALQKYERFRESDQFGLLGPEQVADFSDLVQRHEEFKATLDSGQGLPNAAGTQFSNDGGLPALGGQIPDAGQAEGGPLGSPEGEPNGPVQ